MSLLHRLPLFLAALWWGGISALSFLAVPLLFVRLGPSVAGPVAAQLFSLQSWAGIFIGLALLLILRSQRTRNGSGADVAPLTSDSPAMGALGLVLLAMLLAMVQEFGVAQKIVTARATGGDLRFWHALGSTMVLGQWLCAGALLWRWGGAAHHPDPIR